jgi:hypothetical protein
VTQKRDENGSCDDALSSRVVTSSGEAANGTFIPAEATDKAARIKSALGSCALGTRTTQTGESLTPRFQWFLLPAVLLLWLDTILAGRRGRRRRRAAAAETAVAAALLASVMLAGCAPARESIDGAGGIYG